VEDNLGATGLFRRRRPRVKHDWAWLDCLEEDDQEVGGAEGGRRWENERSQCRP
jgi:hypothetical protein